MYNKDKKRQNRAGADWFSTICLVILLFTAFTRLTLTNWVSQLDVSGWLSISSMTCGYLLGRSRLNRFWSGVIAFFVSVLILPASFVLILSDEKNLINGGIEVWDRLLAAIQELLANRPVLDSILFLITVGIIFWVIGILSGFMLVRKSKPWIPLIFLGIIVLVIESYQPQDRKTFYSWLYLTTLLVLLGRSFYLYIRNKFGSHGSSMTSDTEEDFIRGVIIFAVLIGVLAWASPTLINLLKPESEERTQFTEQWDELTMRLGNAFSSINQDVNTNEQTIIPSMALGTGQVLSDEMILNIQTDMPIDTPQGIYWRGTVYDYYANGRWRTADTRSVGFTSPFGLDQLDAGLEQQLVNVNITSNFNGTNRLYIIGEPTHFDRHVIIESADDQESLTYSVNPEFSKGAVYIYQTIVTSPSADQLRQSNENYPSYITERYLQLPLILSEKFLDLSLQITSGKTNAFDKTVAITKYLRRNLRYQSVVEPYPKDQDPVEWFLFDYKKGFCNYYASAEVLLLRAAGIPARLAVGYAQGDSNETGDTFVVRRNDKHAWPEVYFSGYGWIPFEPTTTYTVSTLLEENNSLISQNNNPVNQNPSASAQMDEGENTNQNANNTVALSSENLDHQIIESILIWTARVISLIAGLIIICIIVRLLRNNREWITQWLNPLVRKTKKVISSLPVIGKIYNYANLPTAKKNFRSVELSLRILGFENHEWDTAKEKSATLSREIPEIDSQVQELLFDYQDSVYGTINRDYSSGKTLRKEIIKASIRQRLYRTLHRTSSISQS